MTGGHSCNGLDESEDSDDEQADIFDDTYSNSNSCHSSRSDVLNDSSRDETTPVIQVGSAKRESSKWIGLSGKRSRTSIDSEPRYSIGDESSDEQSEDDTNADEFWRCGIWVADQFGDKLIVEGQLTNVELPEPDLNYNPVSMSHLDTFYRFFDSQFFESVAETTNIHCGQQMAKAMRKAQLEKWHVNRILATNGSRGDMPQSLSKDDARALVTGENVVTGREIEIYLGIVLHMSVVELPELRMYWEGLTKMENISSAMSFNKFNHIRAHLQLVDLQHSGGRLKVAPLLSRFQKKCEDLPVLSTLRIVETVIPLNSCARDATYYYDPLHSGVPRIRIFTLRSRSGLIQGLRCYSGKQAIEVTATVDSRLAVVKDLMSNLPQQQQPYKLLLDAGFCTVDLLKRLRESGICATGILTELDSDAESLFKLLQFQQMLDSTDVFGFVGITAKDGSVYACRWMEKNAVTVGSNVASANPVELVPRVIGRDTTATERPHCAVYLRRKAGTPGDHNMLRAMARNDNERPTSDLIVIYWILGAAVRNCWSLEHRWRSQIEARNNSSVYEETSGNWESLITYVLDLAEKLMRPNIQPERKWRTWTYSLSGTRERREQRVWLKNLQKLPEETGMTKSMV